VGLSVPTSPPSPPSETRLQQCVRSDGYYFKSKDREEGEGDEESQGQSYNHFFWSFSFSMMDALLACARSPSIWPKGVEAADEGWEA
jgi:hypothetical protein